MYKKVKREAVPTRTRKAESSFERTPEWKAMRADIQKGLPKKDESLQVTLTEEDLKKLGITHRRAVARFLQKYIKENSLPLKVRSFNAEGVDFVVVDR